MSSTFLVQKRRAILVKVILFCPFGYNNGGLKHLICFGFYFFWYFDYKFKTTCTLLMIMSNLFYFSSFIFPHLFFLLMLLCDVVISWSAIFCSPPKLVDLFIQFIMILMSTIFLYNFVTCIKYR